MPPSTHLKNNTDPTFLPEKFVKEHYRWMLALATRIMGEKSLAEDVVQEALIKALSNIHAIEKKSSINSWLRKTTINHAINLLRKTKRLAEETFDEFQPEYDATGGCRIEPKWAILSTPETLLSQKNTHEIIQQAFDLIPASHALIVKLRDIEGYDTKEVANFLNLSEANVKVRLHRARSALKKILEPLLKNQDTRYE